MNPTHRVALVGDASVGKTSLLQKNLTGEFISEYTPTAACHVTTLGFTTNHGTINLEILDIPGAQLTSSSKAEHFSDVEAAIILFDLSRRETFEKVACWHNEILSANKSPPPIVICGTKADIPEEERNLTPDGIVWPGVLKNLEYFALSIVDASADLELPFLSILRCIYNDPELNFVPAYCCFPLLGKTSIGPEELARWSREMEDAAAKSLPSGDESDL